MIHYQNLSRDAATVSLLQRLSPQRCLYMYNVFMPPALTKTTAVCPGMRSCWNLRAATKSWRKTSLPFSLNTQSSRHFAETANLRGEIKCLAHSVIENHGGKSEVLYKKVMEKELVHLYLRIWYSVDNAASYQIRVREVDLNTWLLQAPGSQKYSGAEHF